MGGGGCSELVEGDERALFGIDLESNDALQDSTDDSKTKAAGGVYRMADRPIQIESEREDQEMEKWRAEKIDTAFGTTDDVVNLMNEKTYYFFKLPHKVIG